MFKKLLIPAFLLCTIANLAFAEDISLRSEQFRKNETFFIRVHNTHKKNLLKIAAIQQYFAGKTTYIKIDKTIAPGKAESYQLTASKPAIDGSYNLCVTLLYRNGKHIVSHLDNKTYIFGNLNQPIITTGKLDTPTLKKTGKISLRLDSPKWLSAVKVILPKEIKITAAVTNGNLIQLTVKNTTPSLNNRYQIYWLLEQTIKKDGKAVHAAGFFHAPLQTKSSSKIKIPTFNIITFFPALTILFLLACMLAIPASTAKLLDKQKILAHSLFLLFVVDLLIVIFQIPGFLQGRNYSYFRNIGLTPLFLFYLFYTIYSWITLSKLSGKELDEELQQRKTWLIFSYFHAKLIKGSNCDPNWSKKRKTAFLAVLVKFFYIPLLWSWTLHNIFRLPGVLENFQLTLLSFNHLLVDIFILFDVAIFAFSYAVESRRLKTEIRSVEPTMLGWLVCLLCYPPFNRFFGVFDQFVVKIFGGTWRPPVAGHDLLAVATIAISALWFIYLTATFALGGKASNLTNRGIVTRFPYTMMRHPAYISKNLLWIIGFLFLGKSSLAIVVLGCVIYYLRALTEENHLSMEPAYVKYTRKVKYRFIPGIF